MADTHHVAGTVKQDGSSVSREIRVIDASNGALLASADSTGGEFDIGLTSDAPVFVQAIPAEGYRPLIKGPLTPKSLKDFRAAVEALGPSHWWKLDDNLQDSGPYSRHGTDEGSTVMGLAGLHSQGTAIQTSKATNSWVSLDKAVWSDFSGLGAISIEMIVRKTAGSSDGTSGTDNGYLFIAPVQPSPYIGAGIMQRDGRFRLGGRYAPSGSFVSIHSSTAMAQDATYHLVGVISPATDALHLFVNGALDDEDTSAGFGGEEFEGSASGAVKAGICGSQGEVTAKAHEVIIYPRALTPAEIANNYSQLVLA